MLKRGSATQVDPFDDKMENIRSNLQRTSKPHYASLKYLVQRTKGKENLRPTPPKPQNPRNPKGENHRTLSPAEDKHTLNASKDPAITFREQTDEFFLKQDNFSPIPKISPLKLEASFVQNILNLPETRQFDPLSYTSSIVHRDSNLQRYASPHPFSEVRRSES